MDLRTLLPSLTPVAIFLSASLIFYVVKASSKSRVGVLGGLPPGPKLDPFLGHLRFVSLTEPWKSFAEWGQQWGDVVYTSILGTPMVILNSIEATRDLLDKRGAIYSDRPHSMVWNDALGWGNTIPFMRYGDRWRRQRRIMQQAFNVHSIHAFQKMQTEKVRSLMKDLLDRPQEFMQALEQFTSSMIVKAAYGYEVKDEHDPLVSLATEAASRSVAEGVPGGSVYDCLPWLRFAPSWFPGASFKERWRIAAQLIKDTVDVPFALVCNRRKEGNEVVDHSFTDDLLDKHEARASSMSAAECKTHLDDIKNVAGTLYAAGVETTGANIATFFLMMARHPQAVARAQEEIDQVIGNDRLPTLDDRKNIPFVDCIMKEVLRHNAPFPLSFIHMTTEDDVYKGMYIPKGTSIVPNIWNMLNDERFFPDPTAFRPERFVDKLSGVVDPTQALNGLSFDDPSSIVYGFGRRICPGRHFADAAVWLVIANTLAVFNIEAPTDSAGNLIPPDAIFSLGATLHPLPFNCVIKPRNDRCTRIIQNEC